MVERKSCPVDGCDDAVPPVYPPISNTILCRKHWNALPQRYRDDVQKAWARLREGGNTRWRRLKGNAYLLACSNAIKAAGRKPGEAEDMPA